MAYRKNVSDKDQSDIERVADHSAIRIHWFDGKTEQTGVTKSIPAYDLQPQGNSGGTSNDAIKQVDGSIGSHNDKPNVFEDTGRGGPPSPTPPAPLHFLHRIDFSQFSAPGEQMFSGTGHQTDFQPQAVSNNNWDILTEGMDANTGNDGVNVWNLLSGAGGSYPLEDSLGGSGNASIDLPLLGQTGNGQGGTSPNWLRFGYIDWSGADLPFTIHLGATAAGRTIMLFWYTLGDNQPYTSAIEISGNTVQLDWGPNNVVEQDVTADGAGDITGVFLSSAGINNTGHLALAGLQICQC